jgi:hypothetical protein
VSRSPILLSVGVGLLLAQAPTLVRDALHGYEVQLPEGWIPLVSENLIAFWQKESHFYVATGATKVSGSLQTTLQQVLAQLRHVGGPNATFYTRKTAKSIEIIGENLSYPYFLRPIAATSPLPLPESYRFLGEIFPGQSSAVLTFFWIPEGAEEQVMQEARTLIQSLRFLPAAARVPYRKASLPDPYLGVPHATLHVPQGATVQGTPFRQGEKYFYRYDITYGSLRIHSHTVDLVTQTVMGVSGSSQVIVDGQMLPLGQVVFLQGPENLPAFLQFLWQQEGGLSWQVVKHTHQPQPLPNMGGGFLMGAQQSAWEGNLTLQAGGRRREVGYQLMIYYGHTGSGEYYQAQIFYKVMDYPTAEEQKATAIATGVFASYQPTTEWTLRANKAYTQTVQQNNARLQEYLRQRRMHSSASYGGGGYSSSSGGGGEDYTSEMARTWSNALSDQTYLRDPESGEVMRVHKQVWDEGRFWKDPTFGEVYGTVQQGSELEGWLQSHGWTPMQESLSGSFGGD